MKTQKTTTKVNTSALDAMVSNKLSGTKVKKTETPEKAIQEKVLKTKTPKEKVVTKVKAQATANLVEEVISKREVKYIYPDDITDTLSRKKFRQEVRNQLKKLELVKHRIEDKTSKEFLKAEKEYNKYFKTVIKPEGKVA